MKTIKKANVLLASTSLPSCVARNIRPSLFLSQYSPPPLQPLRQQYQTNITIYIDTNWEYWHVRKYYPVYET